MLVRIKFIPFVFPVFLLPYFSNEGSVNSRLKDDAGELLLVPAYMPRDNEMAPPPYLLRKPYAEARRRKARVIIGLRQIILGSSDII